MQYPDPNWSSGSTRYILRKEQVQASTDGARKVVERLLQKLPVGERSVMVLHYFNGLSCEEVGEYLDVSPNTVKSRLYRARKRLESGGVDDPRNFESEFIKK